MKRKPPFGLAISRDCVPTNPQRTDVTGVLAGTSLKVRPREGGLIAFFHGLGGGAHASRMGGANGPRWRIFDPVL